MSITASYRRLPEEEFQRLLTDATLADAYFALDIDEDDDEGIDAYHVRLAYYDRLTASGRYLDIHKSWDGLHCLLTGSSAMEAEPFPPPLGNVVQGGTPTEWEATYGTVRYLMPQEVKDVAGALEGTNEAELRQRYNPKDFLAANLYPSGVVWDETEIEELLQVFRQVRDFFSVAAREDEVVLLSSD